MSGSFFTLLQATFRRRADAVALEEVERGREYRFADLDALSARFARVLTDLGARRGDRVAVQVEKSPAALAVHLACLRAGLVFLPLNPAYRADEVAWILENAEPAIFVRDPARGDELDPRARAAGVRRVVGLDAGGGGELAAMAAEVPADFPPVPVAAEEHGAMLYTSGTTGRPKGAPLSHGNLASNARVLVEAWAFGEDDVLLHALPIYHAHGLFVAAHCALLAGARMLWLRKFDAERVAALLPRATVFMGVPTMYVRLLERPELDRARTAGMRLFVSGSAPLSPEVWRAFRARTGHEILERYGMSEILMHTGNPYRGERRPGTVGRPFPGSEVRIVDDAGRARPPGQPGHVLVRGPNVFRGYWRDPEANAEAFTEDGWFRTGDLGFLSEDGYLTLVGRARDLIITGGLNVYPREVEDVIDAVPGVRESAVVGLPHPDFGEAVTAVVVREPGTAVDEGTILDACRARLAGYKVPKRVLFVEELPRNTMGKVQKRLLRERFRALYRDLRPGKASA